MRILENNDLVYLKFYNTKVLLVNVALRFPRYNLMASNKIISPRNVHAMRNSLYEDNITPLIVPLLPIMLNL